MGVSRYSKDSIIMCTVCLTGATKLEKRALWCLTVLFTRKDGCTKCLQPLFNFGCVISCLFVVENNKMIRISVKKN
ncbi:hypothetical protein HanPI659440_Chr09g0317701 [Helianthus annuus]|nr:hypothetical protein HanPI659440_Chr09g0317701 [Helianthus annuus]